MSPDQDGEPLVEADDLSQQPAGAQPTGPRGGTTTITKSGMVKKNFWLPHNLAESLRTRAFHERMPESEIIRQALHNHLEETG